MSHTKTSDSETRMQNQRLQISVCVRTAPPLPECPNVVPWPHGITGDCHQPFQVSHCNSCGCSSCCQKVDVVVRYVATLLGLQRWKRIVHRAMKVLEFLDAQCCAQAVGKNVVAALRLLRCPSRSYLCSVDADMLTEVQGRTLMGLARPLCGQI